MGNVSIKNESCSSASSSSHRSQKSPKCHHKSSNGQNGQSKQPSRELASSSAEPEKSSRLGALKEEDHHVFLSEEDIRLVRSSWRQLQQSNDLREYGTMMMIKIFLKHPEVKHIWKFASTLKTEEEMRNSAQLKSHGKNVFEAINAAVNSLDKIDALNSSLNELGSRHEHYGARTQHFPIIAEALIETISEALQSDFTKQHRTSWEKLINYIDKQMSLKMD